MPPVSVSNAVARKLIRCHDLDPVPAQPVAKVAAVVGEEVVGACGYDESAHVGVGRIAGQAGKVGNGCLLDVNAAPREAPAQVVDPAPRGVRRESLLLDEGPLGLRQ